MRTGGLPQPSRHVPRLLLLPVLAALLAPAMKHRSLEGSSLKVASGQAPLPEQCAALCRDFTGTLNTSLPNVLVLGDQVALPDDGYFPVVQHLLRDLANVYASPGYVADGVPPELALACGTSLGALSCVDHWLGEGPWDAISFNWGLQDVCPDVYGSVSDDEYMVRVELMYEKMRAKLAPGGRVVWHSSTPVPPGHYLRNDSSVRSRNKLISMLFEDGTDMDKRPFVHDLYTKVVVACRAHGTSACYPETCACPQFQDEGKVLFKPSGNVLLGSMVSRAVMRVLFDQTKSNIRGVQDAYGQSTEGGDSFDWQSLEEPDSNDTDAYDPDAQEELGALDLLRAVPRA